MVGSLDLNVLREIMMIREPLIPMLGNLEKMRDIAGKIHELDWESGGLASTVLANTKGGRELEDFEIDHSEFMGMRVPYRPRRSNGDSPPVADDARLDHVQDEDSQTGPEAKPDKDVRSSRQRARPGDPNHVSGHVEDWERKDHWVDRHVTTCPAGPEWRQVTRRRVYDLDTEELIEDVEIAKGSEE